MKEFKVGDRVIYVSDAHREGPSNPLWGGKYGNVVGTVVSTTVKTKEGKPAKLNLSVRWDNEKENVYESADLRYYDSYILSKGEKSVIEKAKSVASDLRNAVKPYEKYIGLLALAAVIDHFLLKDKFASRFKSLAEVLVTRITDGLDKLVERLAVWPEKEIPAQQEKPAEEA